MLGIEDKSSLPAPGIIAARIINWQNINRYRNVKPADLLRQYTGRTIITYQLNSCS